ncbi:hypothetical protein XBFM1_2120004 [Xenorhabdus bovienii str. feltiae Moldova]|uniref:Uncharacterized protein n=1 Tax=Xenorhabdus bovienii str. feltiae Moldova TaxID=1398200 RepID=A0A077NGX8_XENBV|nr:hypothetical protein XBFM1_2120004 [Xenorhabdus bovienii str. feltiae Moldova]
MIMQFSWLANGPASYWLILEKEKDKMLYFVFFYHHSSIIIV